MTSETGVKHDKSDADIRKDVLAELEWDPAIDPLHVGVAVRDGVLTLTGHLDTYAEKYAVQRAVQRVEGVHAVAVEIDVKLEPGHRRSDSEMSMAMTCQRQTPILLWLPVARTCESLSFSRPRKQGFAASFLPCGQPLGWEWAVRTASAATVGQERPTSSRRVAGRMFAALAGWAW